MRMFLAVQGMFPRKISFGADSLIGMNSSVFVGSVLVGSVLVGSALFGSVLFGSVLGDSVLRPLCPCLTGEDTAAVPLDDPCRVRVDTVLLGVDTKLVKTDTFDLIGLDILVFN